jgi:TrpR-related protein YerC/YecD
MPSHKRFTDDTFRREPWFKALCSAILSCTSEQEVADFLRDVGTLSELQAWSERLEVAKQLAQGLTYREVAKNTGASTTTVTRVAKFIENGPGGYRKILQVHRHHRMNAQVRRNQPEAKESRQAPPEAQKSVLQKYLEKK